MLSVLHWNLQKPLYMIDTTESFSYVHNLDPLGLIQGYIWR